MSLLKEDDIFFTANPTFLSKKEFMDFVTSYPLIYLEEDLMNANIQFWDEKMFNEASLVGLVSDAYDIWYSTSCIYLYNYFKLNKQNCIVCPKFCIDNRKLKITKDLTLFKFMRIFKLPHHIVMEQKKDIYVEVRALFASYRERLSLYKSVKL